jgi:hypothetical protein
MSWLDGALLRSLLIKLHGDVAALSACACVCKPWQLAATRDARVWRRLTVPPALAPKLTDARLAVLLGRCAGTLRRIDLTGCAQLSAAAIDAALTAARGTLTHVAVAHTAISGCRVVIALAGMRLTLLSVRGLEAFDADDVDDADDDAVNEILALLQACVGQGAEPVSLRPPRMEFYTVRKKAEDSDAADLAGRPYTAARATRIVHYAKNPTDICSDEDDRDGSPLGIAVPPPQEAGLDVAGVCAARLLANGELAYGYPMPYDYERESLDDAVRTCGRLCGGAAARAAGDVQCRQWGCRRWVCSRCAVKLRACTTCGLLSCNSCVLVHDGFWCNNGDHAGMLACINQC